MNILITGGSGFVAPYLAAELVSYGHNCILTALKETIVTTSRGNARTVACDLCQEGPTRDLIRTAAPDAIIHLAGFSHVGHAWDKRRDVIDINMIATRNVCVGATDVNKKVVLLAISSSMVYSPPTDPGDSGGTGTGISNRLIRPLDEYSPIGLFSPYGMSKLGAECIVRTFSSDQLIGYVVRPFNHCGVGQTDEYVCTAFARRIAATKDNGVITVGNLEARRDFTDVRDVVRAYRLIVEHEPEQRLFVIGSGRATRIRDILDKYISISGKRIRVETDPALLRPADSAALISNPSLIKQVLHWEAQIPLSTTLREIYTSCTTPPQGPDH